MKFNKDYKNVLRNMICLLEGCLIGDFVPDCLSHCVSGSSMFNTLFSLTVPNFIVFFQVIG